MSFWENLGESISIKGKEVADKAKTFTDIAGLRSQIVTCQNTIKNSYKNIVNTIAGIKFSSYLCIAFERKCC